MILDLAWPDYTIRPWLGSSALDDWRSMGREAWAEKWLAERGEGYSGDQTSSYMANGSELDAMLTAAVYDRSQVAVKPKGMTFASTDGKAWRTENAGKVIIKADDIEFIDAALPRAKEALLATPADPEDKPVFQVTLRGTVGGLQVQTRPDIFYRLSDRFQDLKYINSRAFDDFDRHFWPGRYAIQAGLAYGLAKEEGLKPVISFLLVESGIRFPRVRDVMLREWQCEACWREVQNRCAEITEAIEKARMIDFARFGFLDLPAWIEKAMGEA